MDYPLILHAFFLFRFKYLFQTSVFGAVTSYCESILGTIFSSVVASTTALERRHPSSCLMTVNGCHSVDTEAHPYKNS